MQKSAVIFADQDNEEKPASPPVSKQKKVTLSRDQYREIVKEAYQEGIEDARKQKPHPNQPKGLSSSSKHEARQEAKKTATQELEENKQRFETIVARHDIELLHVKTLWPFSIFPDTLIIDTTKITIVRKQLFATEFITTVPLKDVSDATVQTALFMGSLTLKYMPQSNSPGMLEPVVIRISCLRREDAIKAKNFLKGALVAKAEEIDIAKLPPEDVKNVLQKFGKNEGVD